MPEDIISLFENIWFQMNAKILLTCVGMRCQKTIN